MAAVTKPLNKDIDALQSKLDRLGKNKVALQLDAQKARSELQALQKQFSATGKESDGLKVELAQANYDNIQRNLRLVTSEARSVEKQMASTAGAVRRTENSMGGGFSSMNSALAAAGAGQMIGQLFQQGANAAVTSMGGSAAGTVFSSALSSAFSGAAMGSMMGEIFGLPGAAVGALAGGALGAASGSLQVFEQRDSAFKSYVQEAVEDQIAARESDISSGSSIAAQREKDLISFSTLFGSRGTATKYLSGLVDMANTTPFLYDDLTAMSKTLATYGYGANGILPVLRTIGDAGAALGMSTSDMSMVATALGRMKSSDKTTLEYLNILNDRGIGAVGMLSNAYGVDQGTMYDMISKGKVKGTEAVEIILQALTDSFSGSMVEQSKTFSGLTSTLEGMEQQMQNAYGEGYNEARKQGLSEEIGWLSGKSGEQMAEANKAIGAWYASLENSKEEFLRKAQQEVLGSDAYKTAMAAGTDEGYAEAGRMLMEAKVKAQNEYNASDGAKLLRESELSLIGSVRADTALNEEYWNAGYERGQEFTKGLAAAIRLDAPSSFSAWMGTEARQSMGLRGASKHAYGLERVPYDDYPALLHQGERVLTAAQARRADRGGGPVNVHIGSISFGAGVTDSAQAADLFAWQLQRDLLLARAQ